MTTFERGRASSPRAICSTIFRSGRSFSIIGGGRLSESDNTLFSTLTLSYNPLYFNAPYARAHGHRQPW